MINDDMIKGKWHEIKGQIRQKWGHITNDELEQISGKREEISGILQTKMGKSKAEADSEVNDFLNDIFNEDDKNNS